MILTILLVIAVFTLVSTAVILEINDYQND